jgi:4-amino-4-deoxy-L-arabinose transferase-like glycosyltransferase
MAERSLNFPGAHGLMARRWLFRLFPILLFLLSFLPRLAAIERYITPDELIWVYRSIQFREALLDGRWADTVVAGHPGVTTTWLGALSMTLQLRLMPASRAAYDWLTTMAVFTPDNVVALDRLAQFLSGGRVAVALVNSLGIVGVYLLARRLWGETAAVVVGLFLAFDPFLVGLSGLFHVDGLSATFVTLSLLALLVGLRAGRSTATGGRSWPWLALAGATAGLAVLSKTPTLLLLPVTGLALLWSLVRDRHTPLRERLWAFLRNGVLWAAAFIVVAALLYPALWASPAAVLATLSGSANRHLDEALRETFFLGRAAFDHGPLFYPVVLFWRLSPVVWLALLPAVWLVVARRRRGIWPPVTFPTLLLAFWAVAFLLTITPAAKKFDRYILPAVPALLLLAAVAWAGWAGRKPNARRWLLALIVSAQVLYWLFYAAYPLTAYNPLVGGPRTAAAVLPVGWGEGISAAGRWLAASRSEVATERAIAGVAPSLAPFFPGQTLVDGLDDPATAHYTIVTAGGRQLDPVGVAAQTAGLDLIHTERFGGLDQAWIYARESPRAPAVPPNLSEPVMFGDRLALVAYEQAVEDDVVAIAARWQRLAPLSPDERYTLRMVIKDEAGNEWAAQERELLNEVAFYPADWIEDETGVVHYVLELPPGIPPATYSVILSLIDNRTAGQLPVRVGGEGFQGVAYTAGEFDAPPSDSVISASRLQIPHFTEATWLAGRLRLLGHGGVPAEALAGGELPIDLFWHLTAEALPSGLQLAWRLRPSDDGEGQVEQVEPLSRHDTGLWRVGETIQEKYRVPLPPTLAAGRYILAVEPQMSDGAPLGPPRELGEIQINDIDRAYDVPMDVARPLLDVCFGATICLRGAALSTITAAPGDEVELVLYWQALDEPSAVYTAFLHVLNEAGETVLVADHWPGGLPSDIWDSGQVITDRLFLTLPEDLPPGEYRLRTGLYDADSGERLPVTSGADVADHLIVPRTLTVQP